MQHKVQACDLHLLQCNEPKYYTDSKLDQMTAQDENYTTRWTK